MRKISKFILLFLFIFGILFFYMKNDESNLKNSSTINIEVLEKYKERGSFFIKVKQFESTNQEGIVEVRDENLWNVLEIGKKYFVVVSWTSQNFETNIFNGNDLKLEQIDLIK
ncbi:hypothetical protein M670_03150 [Schinkia azotoformans MEV2011]|uniref:DUF3221 domain-containing protein n=1 Tax=Schinkia azotoformans MEV2011 TaxID=1348973 RepID=A0A072NJD2_SCHAZ|nr:hypothetical protein [Schinkia azotoformans]KEF37571.1 hypothetical protein M670_03150 [Schinkia azotoformans MEV2011]MEC1695297.1 hypothetical protein [Schinkia azotoformans]MEC1724679.1 hypothetical protein [Schinkia azotoformans]MEC1778017.1 hypothetical protein [Schinkia azotoformans]MED4330952.1 hypothetical protein [Schinkia azotoformans]